MKNKKKVNSHFISIAALSFLLVLIVGELIAYVILHFTVNIMGDPYGIMYYGIPAFAAVVTALVLYVNHRTFGISNTLIDGLNRIAEGDYDVKIQYKKLDSFNGVYENFNKMATELKSVKTLREDFVHNFSHEFKTPIASINGFANLLLEGGLTEEENKQILKIIADESARLSHLSESVLMLSKIENQQFVGEKKAFALDLQLKECIIMLERQWETKHINMSSDLCQFTYEGDESLLLQVWVNLLSNAVKYTPDGGEVNVKMTIEGGKCKVAVSDSGIGIAEEEQARIFDKYYQAGDNKKGNGLGLAICKRIVELCDGEIEVHSKPGEGSTFVVTL